MEQFNGGKVEQDMYLGSIYQQRLSWIRKPGGICQLWGISELWGMARQLKIFKFYCKTYCNFLIKILKTFIKFWKNREKFRSI